MHNSDPTKPSSPSDPSEPCECDSIREHFAKIIDNPHVTGHFLVTIFEDHEPVATAGAHGSKHLARLCGLAGAMLTETQKSMINEVRILSSDEKPSLLSILSKILNKKTPNVAPPPASPSDE